MISIRTFVRLVAILVGAAILGTPPPVYASFELHVSTNGGATYGSTISDGGTGSISTTIGSLTLKATSSNYVSPGVSFLDLSFSGIAAGNASFDLVIQATMDGVNTVPAPQTLTVAYTGSNLPGGGLYTAETWIDNSNTLFGTTGSGIVADTNTLLLPSNYTGTFNGVTPYSVTTQVHARFTNGSTPSSVSLDDNNQITPASAPDAMMLALTGLPVLSLGAWVRRRSNPRLA
jgi:hypothetical protein